MIKLDKLTVKRGEVFLVKDLSWQIFKGDRWVVMGPNGCGKSTLVQLIMGHLFPRAGGQIYYFGHQTPGGNLWDVRKAIGYVSPSLQMDYKGDCLAEYVVVSGFFSSNGVYVEPDKSQWDKVDYWTDFFEITHLRKREFAQLSYGEQRRLLLARAMVHDPSLIILDEPCTGLDIPTREKLLILIEKLGKSGVSMIYVTHVIEEIVPAIDKIMFMFKGQVHSQGEKNLMLTEKKLNDLFGFPYKIKCSNGRYYLNY